VHPVCERLTNYFSCSGGNGTDLTKSMSGHVMLNLCFFLHTVGSVCHVVHFGASGHESLTHYFSCSSGTETDLTKSTHGHVMSNMSFFASGGIYVSRSAFWCIRILK
jgi:hypothetical protein